MSRRSEIKVQQNPEMSLSEYTDLFFTNQSANRFLSTNPIDIYDPDLSASQISKETIMWAATNISGNDALLKSTYRGIKVMTSSVLEQRSIQPHHYMSPEIYEMTKDFTHITPNNLEFESRAGSPEITIFPGHKLRIQDILIRVLTPIDETVSPFIPYMQGEIPYGYPPKIDKLYSDFARTLNASALVKVNAVDSRGSTGKSVILSGFRELVGQMRNCRPDRSVANSKSNPLRKSVDNELDGNIRGIDFKIGDEDEIMGSQLMRASNAEFLQEIKNILEKRFVRQYPDVVDSAEHVANTFTDFISNRYGLISSRTDEMRVLMKAITSTWPLALGVYWYSMVERPMDNWIKRSSRV